MTSFSDCELVLNKYVTKTRGREGLITDDARCNTGATVFELWLDLNESLLEFQKTGSLLQSINKFEKWF